MIGMLNEFPNRSINRNQQQLYGRIPIYSIGQVVELEATNHTDITHLCLRVLPNDLAAEKALVTNFVRSR